MTNASSSQSTAENRAFQVGQEPGAVVVVVNDVLACVSPGHDVVDGTFEFEAKSAGHGRVSPEGPGGRLDLPIEPPRACPVNKNSHFPSLTPKSPSSSSEGAGR